MLPALQNGTRSIGEIKIQQTWPIYRLVRNKKTTFYVAIDVPYNWLRVHS